MKERICVFQTFYICIISPWLYWASLAIEDTSLLKKNLDILDAANHYF